MGNAVLHEDLTKRFDMQNVTHFEIDTMCSIVLSIAGFF